MNLDEIIIGCKKQSITHQKELYLIYSKTLFNLSLKYCTSFTEAEDNLHDSFMEIYQSIVKYQNKGSFEGWIKRITINKAINKFNKRSNFKSIDEYQNIEYEEFDVTESGLSLDILLNLIQQLPNQYRLVFNLYELDDYSHKEIAKLLNISEGTSKSNLSKAKAILKKNILGFQPNKIQNGE